MAQEFSASVLCWLCMKGFSERWIIILRAVYPRKNFPHSHLITRMAGPVTLLSSCSQSPRARLRDVASGRISGIRGWICMTSSLGSRAINRAGDAGVCRSRKLPSCKETFLRRLAQSALTPKRQSPIDVRYFFHSEINSPISPEDVAPSSCIRVAFFFSRPSFRSNGGASAIQSGQPFQPGL